MSLPKIYTATADENGNAVLHIDDTGLYQINASIDDGINTAISETVQVDVQTNHTTQSINFPFATISIRTIQENVITATNGTDSFTFTAASNDPTVVHVSLGDWTLSTTIEGETVSKTISVQLYKTYDVVLPTHFVTRTMDFQANTSTLDTSKGTIEGMFPFIGRRRCNVADDGTINAWYGDANYTEDGSNGQVMVYQPKFWYKTTPITLDGVKIRKASWSIADDEAEGFKLHPAFYDEDGNEVDYILIGAFKACMYDTSSSTYDRTDYTSHDYTVGTGDKLSSIADVKPVSSYGRTSFTRANCKITAENRGAGWHPNNIRVASLNQMMMIVEYGGNMKTLVGRGVVDFSYVDYNGSSITGSTYDIGNGTGRAALTYNSTSGTGSRTAYTIDGKTSVCYRGMEDPWGNINEYIDGINMLNTQPYIATDYNWTESKNTDNYVSCGFEVVAGSAWISAFGYNETFDWLFISAETNSSASSNLIGDGQFVYSPSSTSAYYATLISGYWRTDSHAGAFYYGTGAIYPNDVKSRGARLTYVPQTNRS